MNFREIVLDQIHHHDTVTVPYYLEFEGDVEERLDQHYGSGSWREQLASYIVVCGGVKRRKTIPIGNGRDRDLFGSIWRTDLRPFHLETPAFAEPSLDGYEFPPASAFVSSRMQEEWDKVKDNYPESFIGIDIGWGLWETYTGLRGFENALIDCIAEPDFFEEVLDRLTEQYLEQIEMVAGIPADGLLFGDDWGDQRGVLIGAERWRHFFKPRYAKIFQAARAQGKIARCHSCGSVAEIMPDLIEIGLNVLESVQPEAANMNPYGLKKKWGDKITFWGCLGSQSIIPFGTPQDIENEVRHLCQEMGRGGGFILSPAKPLQPETSTENAVAVVEAFIHQTSKANG